MPRNEKIFKIIPDIVEKLSEFSNKLKVIRLSEYEVKAKLRNIAPSGGYCLGSSNSVPDTVPFKNFKAMLETVDKYGKYPIK